MEMEGESVIAAPQERVWAALNDPEILRQAIPGCQSLEKTGENGFSAVVTSKVGPVKATFRGEVALSDLDPPVGYTISGEGKGGAAGFAKGSARVTLEEEGAQTRLRYTAQSQVGGKLAQIGSRLIKGAAQKNADEFFARFKAAVETAPDADLADSPESVEDAAPAKPAPATAPGGPDGETARAAAGMGLPRWIGPVAAAVIVAAALYVALA